MSIRYDVTWLLTPNQDLYHASKVLSGLCDLRRAGVITLRFTQRLPFPETRGASVLLEVRSRAAGQTRRLAIDLHDRSGYQLDEAWLAWADVTAKRSYHAPDLDHLPSALRAKIVPFGLNHGCLGRSARLTYASVATRLLGRNLSRSTERTLRGKMWKYFDDLRFLRGLPETREFEQPAETPSDGTILFQSRVWPPEDSEDNLAEVNLERAELVRALRRTFKDRFVGGIVADDFARRLCPDVLAEQNTHRRAYIRMSKRMLVGIYTRGLHHSHAFKLSEYLAAALCMVSEPLRNVLPAPLEPGTHLLPFQTQDECLGQCERLLSNPELALAMRRANQLYYETWVRPEAHVAYWLARLFEAPRVA
jgi:hypothetical protein